MLATKDFPKWAAEKVKALPSKVGLDVAEHLLALQVETNISAAYGSRIAYMLCELYSLHEKPFMEITRNDIITFLNKYRKPENVDALHKWIGTYNLYLTMFVRFFKWLYYPERDARDRKRPACLENVKHLKRKEKSIYTPNDMWTPEEDRVFLKYCPDKRVRCYHSMSNDTACRPHELLKLRIRDLIFKTLDGNHYAEIMVNGKTGSRNIPLINSLPYVKEALATHPQKSHPDAFLFYSERGLYMTPLTPGGMSSLYRKMRKEVFPAMLRGRSVPEKDKEILTALLRKKWGLYIRRHSALTEKSKVLREAVLRQYAGWTRNSKQPPRYLHYFGNEASESLLELAGIKKKGAQQKDPRKPKECPDCGELNTYDAKVCSKCKMFLSIQVVEENRARFEADFENYKKRWSKSFRRRRRSARRRTRSIWKSLSSPTCVRASTSLQVTSDNSDQKKRRLRYAVPAKGRNVMEHMSKFPRRLGGPPAEEKPEG